MRGRLIFPLTAEIARLNTAATASNYDQTFKTFKPGTGRVEYPTVKLLAQVEMGQWQKQTFLQAGNAPDSRLTLVFHMRELEQKGLINADGSAKIQVNDRLVAIYDKAGNRLEQHVRSETGGLYVVEAQPAGLGFGGRCNLLVTIYEDRPRTLTTNP